MGFKKFKYDQEDQPLKPDPDDIIISSDGFKYSINSKDHGFLSECTEWSDVVKKIKDRCEKDKWYPNVYKEIDHGILSGPFFLDEL